MVRITLLALLIASSPARGDDTRSVAELNKEAIQLSKSGDLDRAIGIWLDLLTKTGTDYEFRWVFHKNIGRNYQKLGRLPVAWWHLTRAWELSRGGKSKKLLQWVGEVETAMGPDHIKVHIEGEVEGTVVRFPDDTRGDVYRTPFEWWFHLGEHRVRVSAPNREAAIRGFMVTEDSRVVRLSLPIPEGQGIPPPPARRVAVWKWGLLGGGVAAVAAGGATWWVASRNLDQERGEYQDWLGETYGGAVPAESEAAARREWSRRVDRKVTPWQISSYALWGVGGAAAAAAAVLVGLDLAGDADADVQTVRPWALPGGGGLTTTITF